MRGGILAFLLFGCGDMGSIEGLPDELAFEIEDAIFSESGRTSVIAGSSDLNCEQPLCADCRTFAIEWHDVDTIDSEGCGVVSFTLPGRIVDGCGRRMLLDRSSDSARIRVEIDRLLGYEPEAVDATIEFTARACP